VNLKKLDNIKNKITLDELIYIVWGLYLLTLMLCSTSVALSNDVVNTILKGIRYVCYIVFGAKIISDWKNGSKITISFIAMFILSCIVFIVSKNKELVFTVLVLFSLRKLDFDKLVKIALKVISVAFVIIISLALLNIIPDWLYNRGKIVRHSLGFRYATDAIGVYLTIILMYFYIRRDKATIYELLVLETINVLLYGLTDGRTSFILISVILFAMLIARFKFIKTIFHKKYIQKTLKIVCYSLTIVLFIFFHVMVYLYSNNIDFAKNFDKLVSGRINYTLKSYENYKVTIFGQEIDWKGWGGHGYLDVDSNEKFKYNYVDSSYPRMVLDYGVIVSGIIFLVYTLALLKCYRKKNYWLMMTLLFIVVWCFIEQNIINIWRNVFILSFIPYLEKFPINKLDYDNLKQKFKRIKEKKSEKVNN